MSNAFAPLGVYLSFWQPSVEPASSLSLPIMLVNDEDRTAEGTLTLALENENGGRISAQTTKFKVAALGQETLYNDFKFPSVTGNFLLRAIIEYGTMMV